jgi:Tfp pilus assembly protein PilF
VGDFLTAERNLKLAIRGDSENPRYHRAMALVLEKQNKLGEALREMERACYMAPGNPDWMRDLERIENRWREGR